jgi:hypothetical protein
LGLFCYNAKKGLQMFRKNRKDAKGCKICSIYEFMYIVHIFNLTTLDWHVIKNKNKKVSCLMVGWSQESNSTFT